MLGAGPGGGVWPVAHAETATNTAADRVFALLGEATSHYRAGRVEEARTVSVRALELAEKELGPTHPVTGIALNNLGATDLARQDPARAAVSFARALPILEAAEGAQSVTVLQVSEFLALSLSAAGDYAAARPVWERVANQRTHLEGEGLALAGDLVSLGETCVGLGDLGSARSHFEYALRLRDAALGPQHPETIKALHLLGNTLRQSGEFRLAKPLFARMLLAYEPVLGAEHAITLEVQTTLGLLEVAVGELASARSRFERVLGSRRLQLGEDHSDTAQSFNNLGLVLHHLGDYERALDAYERAVAIRRKSQGPGLPKNLNNLGGLRFARGEVLPAKALFEEALTLLERVANKSRDHAEVLATTLNNLGLVEQALGHRLAAKQWLERSVTLRMEVLGPEHPHTAQGFANLGAFLENHDPKGARPFFERALVIYEKVFGKDHADIATTLDHLGLVELALGNVDVATQWHTRALGIRERTLGKDHPDTALSYNNLAIVMQRRGELASARELLERSLAIAEKRLGRMHPDTARTLNNLGVVAMASADTRGAIGFLSRAADIEERLLASVMLGGTEAQKARFAETVASSTHAWISLALQVGDARATELAFETVVRRKGRVLEAAADQLALLRRTLPAGERDLFTKLADARKRLAALTLSPPADLGPETALVLTEDVSREGDRLEEELAKKSEAFATSRRPIEVKDLIRKRPRKSALLELVVHHPYDVRRGVFSAPRFAAFLLSESGLKAVDLGPVEPIEGLAGELRKAITLRRGATRIKAMANLTTVRKLAASLYQLLLVPLGDKSLEGVEELVVSADGELTQVPFETLVGPDGRWLVERVGVRYLTSARELEPANAIPARSGAVFLGGVDYEGAPAQRDAVAAMSRSADRAFSELRWNYLPGTLAELEGLQAVGAFPGAMTLKGRAANEASLRALRGPKVLHIATHGFFLPDVPTASNKALTRSGDLVRPLTESPLIRSGLALAGANQRDLKPGDDDGVLTALEASGLDLQGTELVVLSACETGVGEVKRGDGVVGLARSLVLAGAKTHVMSLWQVDDEATFAMMVAYYQRLARGEGKAEALRKVRLAMITGGEDVAALTAEVGAGPGTWSHPYYWAAFLVHGDGGPLR